MGLGAKVWSKIICKCSNPTLRQILIEKIEYIQTKQNLLKNTNRLIDTDFKKLNEIITSS